MTIDTHVEELSEEGAERAEQKSLESRALKGTYYVVAFYATALTIRLGSSVVLTRVFAPELFGLMALMTTIIVGLTLLSHIGLEDSIIVNPRGDEEIFLNTAWTIQAMRGVGLWIMSILLAWPVAAFYKQPQMLWLLPILGFGCVISGFGSPKQLTLSRHMGIGKLSLLELAPQITLFLVTWGFSYIQRTIWAILIGRIVAELVRLWMSYNVLDKGVRPRFVLDKESVDSLLKFGRWILVGTLLTFLATQSDKMILGKLTTLKELGIYGIAFSLSDLPRQIIQMFSSKVGYPFIARFSDKPRPEYRAVFLKYRRLVLAVGALMLTATICLGDVLIRHIFDKRYHGAAWMVAIFAVGLWHTLLYQTITPAIMSLQKAHYNALANGLYCIALFALLPFAYVYLGLGMLGAVVAVAISDLPIYFVNIYAGWKNGLLTLRQDLLLTVFFVLVLAGGLALRHAVGAPSPFADIPR